MESQKQRNKIVLGVSSLGRATRALGEKSPQYFRKGGNSEATGFVQTKTNILEFP